MTSTILQQQQQPQQQKHATAKPKAKAIKNTKTTATATMAWSNEKLRFSCVDNIGLKQLWKLIALDSTAAAAAANTNTAKTTNHNLKHKHSKQVQQQHHHNHYYNHNNNNNNHNEKKNFQQCENIADFLSNRDIMPPNHMSLLKFLAINALELSAPATPSLLLPENQTNTVNFEVHPSNPQGWMQLSGHPESIVPTTTGIVRKRVAGFTDSEVLAYQCLAYEPETSKIVPNFYGTLQLNGEHFIELQDLLAGFKDPCVMDIKMGCRTFLESEVTNKTLRADLYQKMIAVDAQAPTFEEHEALAITKLRYMLFRESMSSSQTKGFRIEALRLRGRPPMKDLKTVRTSEQIEQTIKQFLGTKKPIRKDLIKRLKQMRQVMEQSAFFQRHEIVGSSIFIVYDETKVGAWLIDFAKSRPLPEELSVSHRAEWTPGNREEGLLKGMDELINAFESVCMENGAGRNCLLI